MTSCQHRIIEDSLPAWDAKYVLLIRGHGTQPTLLRVQFDFREGKDQADSTKTHNKTKSPIKYHREAKSHVLKVRTKEFQLLLGNGIPTILLLLNLSFPRALIVLNRISVRNSLMKPDPKPFQAT